jgi:group I intron endonuclease
MAIIYCTTNLINNKKYIGQHYCSNDNYIGSGKWFLKAVCKYGKSNFKRQILWEGPAEFVDELEEYWLEYFDVANNPQFYNRILKKVGRSYGTLQTEETKNKMKNSWDEKPQKDKQIRAEKISKSNSKPKPDNFSQQQKDRLKNIHTEDRKKMMSNKMTELWKDPSFKEKTQTESKKIKLREKISIPIIQYDLEGNFIKEWKSATEAARVLGAKQSAINQNLKGKTKKSFGYIWKYKNK